VEIDTPYCVKPCDRDHDGSYYAFFTRICIKKNAVIGSYEYNTFIQEEFEDIKEVIRRHKTKKDRQYNGQKIPKG
jgi:hypothetical protein